MNAADQLIAGTQALPATAPGASGHRPPVAVHLAIDEQRHQVMVRVIDSRTGATLREMPSTTLVAVAAQIGRAERGSTETRKR